MSVAEEEARLLASAKAGDRAALERLVTRYQEQIYAFGRRMCRNPEDAKDILQETLLAASRAIGDFKGSSQLSTWLFTIARRFCMRKQQREAAGPLQGEPFARVARTVADDRPDPHASAESKELHEMIEHALSALEPKQREVFILRDVEGMTAPEVAEVLGVRVEAVKSRLHRARSAIRAHLAPLLAPETEVTEPGHPNIQETFSQYLEGEISASVCDDMEQHLAGCASCRTRCDSLKRALALCKAAPAPALPREVAASVREALQAFLANTR